jgi:hypothetical protein
VGQSSVRDPPVSGLAIDSHPLGKVLNAETPLANGIG